jgi:hypothetical protein
MEYLGGDTSLLERVGHGRREWAGGLPSSFRALTRLDAPPPMGAGGHDLSHGLHDKRYGYRA